MSVTPEVCIDHTGIFLDTNRIRNIIKVSELMVSNIWYIILTMNSQHPGAFGDYGVRMFENTFDLAILTGPMIIPYDTLKF